MSSTTPPSFPLVFSKLKPSISPGWNSICSRGNGVTIATWLGKGTEVNLLIPTRLWHPVICTVGDGLQTWRSRL